MNPVGLKVGIAVLSWSGFVMDRLAAWLLSNANEDVKITFIRARPVRCARNNVHRWALNAGLDVLVTLNGDVCPEDSLNDLLSPWNGWDVRTLRMFGEHGEYHQNDFVLGCAIFKETALAALGPKPLGPGVFTDDGCSEVSCDDTDLMSLVAGAGLQIERLDKRVIHRDLKDMKD